LKQFYKILLVCLPFFMAVSCVTQRKKDEAKGLKLFFHNLNSKYNGFFNATVLMGDAVEKLNFQHQDNYNQILDVYPEVAVENTTAVAPDLDKAIEKVAVVATFHRPGHWTDDSYLLLGKAQHYKHDFQSAQETFEYLADVYDPTLKKKMSSKERQKANEEARKEKAKARDELQKAKKAEREEAEKERKKAAEEAKKEKEDRAKKEQEEIEKRNAEKKKEIEQAAKDRKAKSESEKKTITDRNEARRKANEERRIANEEARKQAAKDAKNKNNAPKIEPKKEVAVPTEPKEKKLELKKTGSNATPVFVEEETKKVSRVKGKPKSYFLKHRPCHQEGMVWLARTYTERQNFSDAELILDNLEKSTKTFKDVRRMAAVAKAHLYLKEKNYEQAIPALEYALKINKKKKIKARLAYILAQLYQMNNNNEKAFAAFDKVLDYGPAYEMEFNSRLNMALTTSTSSENTTALLLKMGKNFKNREYGDQIYFTLAQIALKNNDKVKAVEYLQQSLATTGRNKQQKIEAYYMMAKLQYESENYVEAKAYYDSTLTVMAKEDNRKGEVERYATNLVEIASNIEIITLQDSLLKLSSMTNKERKAVATQIRKARADKAAASKTPSVSGSPSGLDPSLQIGASKSNYWAYNTDLVKKGKKEFEKKWGGDRKLEDNWNRSNKKGGNGDFVQNTDIISGEISDKEAQEILKDVPKTPAEIEAAKEKVNEALFQLGTLYHDKLQNDKKSAETLEKHLDRFPANKHETEDFYYLYLAHTELKNAAKAQGYFNRLQEKYPTSQYAQILKDPNVLKNKDAQPVDKFYDDTYQYFKSGDYKKASERIAISESNYGVNNPLKPKFALLNAMCIGSLQGREAYVNALKEVVAKFNETPEQKNAKEMLRILENGITIAQPVADNAIDQGQNSGGFKVENEKLHYVVIILAKDAIVEDAKIAVSDFNTKFHRTEDLKLTSIFINTDPEIPSIIIRRFKDKATALGYTDGIAKNAAEFIKGAKYDVYAISQDNYRELLRQKTLDAYKVFYEKNYKK
jgi:tetratricopeptide (TPR) repeat protein